MVTSREIRLKSRPVGMPSAENFELATVTVSDSLLVMLAPKLAVKQGREAIQKHIQGTIDAGLTNLAIETQQVERRGNDAAWAAGTYTATIKEKIIQGNRFRMFKREDGAWKIAMEGYARAGAIDAPAASASSK